MASGAGSPCGACKFLRRKCTPDCIFAPYFCTDQGADRFAAVHKIFGASNASKLLSNMSPHYRWEAVVSIAYEAQARIHDPVYGCVAHIFALQQQVAVLHAQLMQARAQLAQSMAGSRPPEDRWEGSIADPLLRSHSNVQSSSPRSSLECSDYCPDGPAMGGMCFEEGIPTQSFTKRKTAHDIEWGELQDLAMRMMRN